MKRSISLLSVIFVFALVLSAFAEPLDNWHWRSPLPTGEALNAVVYNNGTFVAVGNRGAILTSPDGETWSTRVSGTTQNLRGVAYGNGTFVTVVGDSAILQSDPVLFSDPNENGKEGAKDPKIFLESFGKRPGQAGYNAGCDFDNDSRVSLKDFFTWSDCYLKNEAEVH